MAFDSILGQIAGGDGKQLPTIPASASQDQLITSVNEIVGRLNNNTQEVVGQGTTNIAINGSPTQVFTIPHNLGYKPRVFAYLNGVTLSPGGLGPFSGVDIPLPTYLSSDIATGFGGGGSLAPINFYSWLDLFIDATNLYFLHRTSNTALIITLPVTYYLTRQASN